MQAAFWSIDVKALLATARPDVDGLSDPYHERLRRGPCQGRLGMRVL